MKKMTQQAIETTKRGQPIQKSSRKERNSFPALPDALVDALAGIIADKQKEWQKDLERLDAQHRAAIAELQTHYHRVVEAITAKSDALEKQLTEFVKGAIANVKDGKDGRDGIDGKDGAPGKDGESGKPGEPGKDGEPGRDGLALVDFLRGHDGHLIITLSDGSTKDMGQFVGKDGAPGEPGKDGRDGHDGKDGLSFEDFAMEFDGEKTFTFKFVRGDIVKEYTFTAPVVIDCGVYRAEQSYSKGDGVSYGGSFWIAQKDAPEGKPEASQDWRLAVKRGRDGKDGKKGDKGDRGPDGKPGKDGAQW
jgi:integrin beta 3